MPLRAPPPPTCCLPNAHAGSPRNPLALVADLARVGVAHGTNPSAPSINAGRDRPTPSINTGRGDRSAPRPRLARLPDAAPSPAEHTGPPARPDANALATLERRSRPARLCQSAAASAIQHPASPPTTPCTTPVRRQTMSGHCILTIFLFYLEIFIHII